MCNVINLVWFSCNHAHISKEADEIIKFNHQTATLLSLIVGGHIALLTIIHPSWHFIVTTPNFSKIWPLSLSAKLSVIIIPLSMNQLSIFTTLVRWNTVYHSIQFSFSSTCWDHQLFYFLQGCCDFPGRSFYYHSSTL